MIFQWKQGYLIGSSTLGAVTCVPGPISGGGVGTVTTLPGTTVQSIALAYKITTSTVLSLNPWLTLNSQIPPGKSR